MTDIIEMARQAGLIGRSLGAGRYGVFFAEPERCEEFARLVAEECAKECDSLYIETPKTGRMGTSAECAEAIRAKFNIKGEL